MASGRAQIAPKKRPPFTANYDAQGSFAHEEVAVVVSEARHEEAILRFARKTAPGIYWLSSKTVMSASTPALHDEPAEDRAWRTSSTIGRSLVLGNRSWSTL